MSLMQLLAHLNLVSFKYNCFTIAGSNCNLRNLGEETYEKKLYIKQRKHVLYM